MTGETRPAGSATPRCAVAAAWAVLAVVLVAGASVTFDPDFDWTFGVEAWRRWGPFAAAAAAAAAGVVVASERAAGAVAGAASTTVRRIPPGARVPLLLAAALAAFLALADVSLSGDAMSHVGLTATRRVQPSNALTSWLHFAAAGLGLEPVEAVRAVSLAAGVLGVAAGAALARALFDDGPRRAAAGLLLLTTGNAALFFGSVEVYAPLGAAVLAYLLVAVRALRGTGGAHLPPLAAGLAFSLHGSAGLLLPSLAVLAWRNAPDGGADRRRALVRVVRAGALFAVPVAATLVGLYAGSWHASLPPSGPDRWGNFLGAMGYGPLLALSHGPADIGPQYALLDAEHTLAVITTLFVAAPAAWALLAGHALCRRRATAEPPADRTLVLFAVAALVPWVVYPCVWNVSYALRRDWDLFSPAGTVLAFLVSVVALRGLRTGAAAARVAALCAFSFGPFVVSNAGDFADRRAFAQAAAATLDSFPDVRGPGAQAASVRRWDEETRRCDLSGSAARIDEGDALKNAGRPEEAAAKYGEAVAAEPTNAIAQLCHGLALLRLGRRDEARGRLAAATATSSEPLRIIARHQLARMALDDRDPDEAIRQVERALHECSWTTEARPAALDLAEAWRRKGRDDLAAEIVRFADTRLRR